MRFRGWWVVWCLIVFAILAERRRIPHSAETLHSQPPAEEDGPTGSRERAFVYDVAARFNERLIGNIDAIDTASMAVLAGNVAVAVFAMDKLTELRPQMESWTIMLLGTSMLACVVGYIVGFRFRAGDLHGVRPRRLIPDLMVRHDEAIIGAIEELMADGEMNMAVRSIKRILTIVAIVFLLAAVVVLSLARLAGVVVH